MKVLILIVVFSVSYIIFTFKLVVDAGTIKQSYTFNNMSLDFMDIPDDIK